MIETRPWRGPTALQWFTMKAVFAWRVKLSQKPVPRHNWRTGGTLMALCAVAMGDSDVTDQVLALRKRRILRIRQCACKKDQVALTVEGFKWWVEVTNGRDAGVPEATDRGERGQGSPGQVHVPGLRQQRP